MLNVMFLVAMEYVTLQSVTFTCEITINNKKKIAPSAASIMTFMRI